MGRERQRRNGLKPVAEINMTPLIDLTFLLLIAFIISFPMIEQGIKVQLPKGDAEKLDPQKKTRTITVKYAGGVFLNDREVTYDALEEALSAIAKEDPQPPVLIRCDERVEYGDLMKTLRLVHACKITRMALVTEPMK
jgi:biopolymer transport protein ExbD